MIHPEGRASAAAPAVVVMGVSAAGKSTIAEALSRRLAVPWIDADDLHPSANRQKMMAGIPLDDDDRRPWLDAVGEKLAAGEAAEGIVVACSALRRNYRDRLRAACPTAVFVHLHGSRELLAHRASERVEHFMPASLLDSQLATLEPLDAEERGVTLDVSDAPAVIAQRAAEWVTSNG
ncbi:gluconokinase [Agromyces kandeliae]|uniref:Gluconokinase n=1 Tax=Agromyces kandeliae TaxID=2666141 RepID=A0A6L5R5G1_9MICO|nr:gluconokinase [Agromyces kandeliae]MRX45209.1 AAA family ATPase [Agromyces kandeliae]